MTAEFPRLLCPTRSVVRRGARQVLTDELQASDGPILLVRGRSVRWVDDLTDTLIASGHHVRTLHSQGEPTLEQIETARAALQDAPPRVVAAIGGGATVDFGKALAALIPAPGPALDYIEVVGRGLPLPTAPLPFFVVPTTAGTGAEATKNAVIDVTSHRRKVSLRDDRMIPDLAILDADLTDGAPRSITLAAGMDALTQLIEPFLSHRANRATDHICRAAIGPAAHALTTLAGAEDAGARDTMLRASHLSGIALANAGLGAVHGLAGVLGGRTGGAHGAICARLLPTILRVNRKACQDAGQPTDRFDAVDRMIAAAFGAPDTAAATLLQDFIDRHGLPTLSALGCRSDDIPAIVTEAQAASSMKANPVPLPDAVLHDALNSCL